jgi:predicted DNA-binding transcriptional regulator YafY
MAIFFTLRRKMPNRNAFIRYRVINSCFKNRGSATLDELKEACEEALDIRPLGRRTIEGDIYDMRYNDQLNFNAPIIYDRRQMAYRYERDDYSIDGVPLDIEELHAIKFAASILKQYKEISYLEEFQGAVQKIVNTINVHRMQEDYDLDFIDLEKSSLVRGTEYLDSLIEYIRERKVIRLTYRKFASDAPVKYEVHPHLLKEYGNRWYLIAYYDPKGEFRNFGLERIHGIDPVFNKVYLKKPIDPESYFRNSIGITTLNEEPSEIVVAFSRQQSEYLATQPIHDTQALIGEAGGRLHFQFTVVPTFEFTSKLLGWGSDVEVISPQWYREKIAALLRDTVRQYGSK